MTTPLKAPTMLAFERKLDPSDAVMHGGRWQDADSSTGWSAVLVKEKSVRGTMGIRVKGKDGDPDNPKASIFNANPQTVDAAALAPDEDTLRVQFTLRVLGGLSRPSSCNSRDYASRLHQAVADYATREQFTELGLRYATNLANARFLWRNRNRADRIAVVVELMQGTESVQQWRFDALSLSLADGASAQLEVRTLGETIAAGLRGERRVLLRVTAYALLGAGQEVFPSQEMVMSKEKNKSRILYSLDGAAAMHSQKIGNAVRTIDTWYEGAQDNGPIAVEVYGAVTTQAQAWRAPKQKMDFYSLLDEWVLKGNMPALAQQHYVMAMLVRGGVFPGSGSGDDK